MSTAVAAVRTAATGVTLVVEGERVTVPAWVRDLTSFRRWADEDDFPEKGRIYYLKGEVLVDMSKEQLFTHVAVKTEFTVTLGNMVKSGHLGLFLMEGAFLSNPAADIGVKPDAVFVATATLESGKVQLVEGKEEGFVELEGSPDMVLEIVSESSVRKDNVVLRQAYWEAGIKEYGLVDARTEPLTFDILRHTAKGYAAARKTGGWVKSAVFGKAFRLAQGKGPLGHPEYTLAVR